MSKLRVLVEIIWACIPVLLIFFSLQDLLFGQGVDVSRVGLMLLAAAICLAFEGIGRQKSLIVRRVYSLIAFTCLAILFYEIGEVVWEISRETQ